MAITPTILIEQATLPPGAPGVSRIDGVVGQLVTCTDPANGGVGVHAWSAYAPSGVLLVLTGGATPTMTFTPPSTGDYLVFLTVDGVKSWTEDVDLNRISGQGGLALLLPNGTYSPAPGETQQFDNVAGYAGPFAPLFPIIDTLRAGVATVPLSVVDIDDPSAELNAIAGSQKGDLRLCYQTVVGADRWSMYAWDNADAGAESVPYRVDGLTGMWSAVAGEHLHSEARTSLTGSSGLFQDSLNDFYAGVMIGDPDINVTSAGGVITLSIGAAGGGDLDIRINGQTSPWDTTPVDTVVLTAGSDTVPVLNYVYATEAAGVITLVRSTVGWPAAPTGYVAIATVYCQSAASLQTDGALKVHAYIDHPIHASQLGHLAVLSKWIRRQSATWESGVAPADLVVASPDAYISTTSGVVYQLHEHAFAARDMQAADPVWLVNEPTTPFKRITTLDDITQLADTGAINNRWFPLVLWGSVNEDGSDCKTFINLPGGSYPNQSAAESDGDRHAVFSIPTEFTGTGFLIATYVVQGKNSGAWVQGSKVDLRGKVPSTSPGGSAVAAGNDGTNCLIYKPGGGEAGPVEYDSWATLYTNYVLIKATGACVNIRFDDTVTSPAVVPAGGPYDFANSWLEGMPNTGAIVNFADGTTVTNLRQVRSQLQLTNLNASGALETLTAGSKTIIVEGYSIIQTGTGLASTFFDCTAATFVVCDLRSGGALGFSANGPVFKNHPTGATLAIRVYDVNPQWVPLGGSAKPLIVQGDLGATLVIQAENSRVYSTTDESPAVAFPNWAGTIVTQFIGSALLSIANTWTKAQNVAQVTLTAAASVAVNGALSNSFDMELDQNVTTLGNPSGVIAGATINVAIRQDGVGGFTCGFGTAWKFPGGAPTISAGINDEDLISAYVRTVDGVGNATVMLCSIAQDHT